MRAWSLFAVLFAVDAFPHERRSSDEVVQAMIVELLNAGGGGMDGFETNETTVDFANATDVVRGNLTEDRPTGGGMRRAGQINGFENNWWEIAPEHTRTAFKKCCVDKGTLSEPCIRHMCDWEPSRRMEIGRPIKDMSVRLNSERCIEDLRQLADYLFCFSGGQDNTACCNAAEVTTRACLDLCAGTLPPEGMNSRAFKACSEAGNGEERMVGLCSVFAYMPPVTRAPPVFPTLECLRTVTEDINGTMVASCV